MKSVKTAISAVKRISFITMLLLSCNCFAGSSNAPISVKWVMGHNEAIPNYHSAKFVIKNISDSTLNGNWDFYFNNFARDVKVTADNGLSINQFFPSYFRISPTQKGNVLLPGDSLVLNYFMHWPMRNISYKPDGGHFIFRDNEKKIYPIDIEIPLLTAEYQWGIVGKPLATYPTGEYVYGLNESINPKNLKLAGGVYNILPTPKKIKLTGGEIKMPALVSVVAPKSLSREHNYLNEKLAKYGVKEGNSKFSISLSLKEDKSKSKEYYTFTVDKKGISIQGATADGVLNGVKTLISVIQRAGDKKLPYVAIVDYPDLKHRGMMLDIARNFTNYENLKKYIDVLASYKVNVYHFHFCDDEAWRLEIPGLPELTNVGARKGYTLDEKEFLKQTYAGTGNPNDASSANGYITKTQFVDLIKYANSRGVEIIPEIEAPGHARAAIVSMKARYNNNITTNPALANEYVVWDGADSSKYTSSQGYHDNVLNIALPGTYKFMEKVTDEIIAMYKEAGVSLKVLHIGGDEVPHGSWEGSPAMHSFLKEKGLKDVKDASEYFLDKVSEMIASKNLKVGGWQEVAMHHSEAFNKKVAPRFYGVYVWSTMGSSDSIPYSIANHNYPVILSNVNCFYFDMIYNRHQYEMGLNWGGAVDEFSSWAAQPFNNYRSTRIDNQDNFVDLKNAANGKPALKNKSLIEGVQSQIWAETIRNFDMVELYTYPRLFGMSERGWNATPEWGEEYADLTQFNADRAQYNLKIGVYELPRLKKEFNSNFHLGQPGIIVKEGLLIANTQYPNEEVRYTLDGTEPNANSTLWTAPIHCNAKEIKAKSFYLGKESNTSTFIAK